MMSERMPEKPAVAESNLSPSDEKGFGECADNGGAPAGSATSDVSKEKDDVSATDADKDEDLVQDSLRSPVQTRVKRISAELRRAGKGLCTAAASRLTLPTAPRSLRRRSWHCEDGDDEEETEEDCLLVGGGDGDGGRGRRSRAEASAGLLGSARSKSSESLLARRGKERGADLSPRLSRARAGGERSFLARRWDAMTAKSRAGAGAGDEEKPAPGSGDAGRASPVSGEPAGDSSGSADPVSWDSNPVVFEPLTLSPRCPAPAVTISVDPSPTHKGTNPFWD